ncbi:hypothetical protein BDR26DRAFT_850649 [Obelidium mucronatum]|nr:hypothetical protein BDR26DRAFT_850649 [Obelidium mucronatum]
MRSVDSKQRAASICSYCSTVVPEGQVLQAVDGQTWHAEHFMCGGCGKLLEATSRFTVRRGFAVCSECKR